MVKQVVLVDLAGGFIIFHLKNKKLNKSSFIIHYLDCVVFHPHLITCDYISLFFYLENVIQKLFHCTVTSMMLDMDDFRILLTVLWNWPKKCGLVWFQSPAHWSTWPAVYCITYWCQNVIIEYRNHYLLFWILIIIF